MVTSDAVGDGTEPTPGLKWMDYWNA